MQNMDKETANELAVKLDEMNFLLREIHKLAVHNTRFRSKEDMDEYWSKFRTKMDRIPDQQVQQ